MIKKKLLYNSLFKKSQILISYKPSQQTSYLHNKLVNLKKNAKNKYKKKTNMVKTTKKR